MDEDKTLETETSMLAGQIGANADRKMRARDHTQGVWFGLGMMGLIGWSVVVPTLLGAAAGHWLDHHFPNHISWTLTLLLVGLVFGCVNAWRWVAKEEREMKSESGDSND